MKIIFRASLVAFFFPVLIFAQSTDTTLTSGDSTHLNSNLYPDKIKATVYFDKKSVPLNRTARFTLDLSWEGDLDRFKIEKVEDPVFTNLEVVSNSTSNQVGASRALKSYEYVVHPKSLGMAYVDGIVVEYRDTQTDKLHRLITNRLEISVIEPVKESQSGKIALFIGIGLSVIVLSIVTVVSIKNRKLRQQEERLKAIDMVPVEEKYLGQLKEQINLKEPQDKDNYAALSKLFKKYLAERYQISALETSTEEIVHSLKEQNIAESNIKIVDEVLRTCDVVKFSGSQPETGQIERLYTLVEDLLQKNKTEFIEFTNQAQLRQEG
ncbi:MAG: hypothetical protein D6813_11895 [Calditrichaeota bacterium]|nr:MAG: hypothetical protein D6813_11895 [Calditrichota bacterium]